MLHPDTLLFIYEVTGDPGEKLPDQPESLVGVWNEDDLSYLFFDRAEDVYVEELVSRSGLNLSSRHELFYKDWQTGIPDSGVSAVGLQFVLPDHSSPPDGAILLDPSVVFGDGSHPTTLACLHMLREIVSAYEIRSLLDLGTGTGIVALAGARMGIERILAIDKNRLAVHTARQNVIANQLESIIRIEEGEARFFIDTRFDVVVANLPFQVLRELSTLRGARLHDFWVVSGISEYQGSQIKELLGEQGYTEIDYRPDPPWVTFAMRRADTCP
jgi:ribosomal protein L11 methyltransferase